MNKIYYGDNLDILSKHIADSSVDLIYIDPPFNSKRNYNVIYDGAMAQAEAFSDTWSLSNIHEEKMLIFKEEAQRYSSIHNIIECLEKLLIGSNPPLFGYLLNMSIRLVELHRVLKDSGSIYLHCDPTASHYLKILLDEIFGKSNFRNEIIWCYDTGGRARRNFPRKHDTIFCYSKGLDFFFNYKEVAISRDPTTMHETVQYDENGKPFQRNIKYGKEYKYYLDHGVLPNDWWNDIQAINPAAKERLGYPTQKPLALLERIIKASCPLDSIVLDAFCGCGTSVAAAKKLGRRFIGIDITYLSIDLIKKRLIDTFYGNEKAFYEDVQVFGIPKDLESARALATKTSNDKVRKEFEKWAIFKVGGIYTEKKGADLGIDGYFYFWDIDNKGKAEKQKGIIQVKSGKVGIASIRDFGYTVDREKVQIGFFITLEQPTRQMIEEVSKMAKVTTRFGKAYDKIYLITVEDILADNLPKLPMASGVKSAERIKQEIDNGVDIEFE